MYKNQAVIQENGDDGDSFNYSPPREDLVTESTMFTPDIKVRVSNVIQTMDLDYRFDVPKNLHDRAKGIRNSKLPVSLSIVLKSGSPIIEFGFKVDNRFVDSHRMCVLFNSEIASKFSKADHQFGSIQRPVVTNEMNLWQLEPDKWNEVPISIETCQSFVTLDNTERGLAIIPKAVREYEIVGDEFSTIRLTLFRTYGHMGRENLLYRPGRASGETVIATPDAQCHKVMTFDFSVIYYKGDMNTYKLAQVVNEYLKDIQVYQYSEYLNTRLLFTQFEVEKNLPTENSLFRIEGEGVLSLVKKAETRTGYIIRFYNGDYNKVNNLKISFVKKPILVEFVDLKEECKQVVSAEKITFPKLEHNKFITLYVEF